MFPATEFKGTDTYVHAHVHKQSRETAAPTTTTTTIHAHANTHRHTHSSSNNKHNSHRTTESCARTIINSNSRLDIFKWPSSSRTSAHTNIGDVGDDRDFAEFSANNTRTASHQPENIRSRTHTHKHVSCVHAFYVCVYVFTRGFYADTLLDDSAGHAHIHLCVRVCV